MKITDKYIEQVAKEYSKEYKKIIPFEIDKINNFYVYADHGALGLYLLINGKKYTYMEDARGIYTNWKDLARIIEAKDYGMHVTTMHYKGYGKSDLITQKYIAFSSQPKECNFKDCNN